MAVNKDPFEQWKDLKNNCDYRNTDTQNISFVRQQLSEPRYLRISNRVNPGPYRNLRANIANSAPPLPHPTWSEDMWGWQKWAEEERDWPYGEVGGASS